jgi:hypothetical protein
MGCPVACTDRISSITASSFSAFVSNRKSGLSSRITGRLVGMTSTYIGEEKHFVKPNRAAYSVSACRQRYQAIAVENLESEISLLED